MLNAGVVAGDAIYFFFTAIGLGSLWAASYWAFTFVKWLGVTYLIYLGLRSLLCPASEIVGEDQSTGRKAFVTAITVQLANPKLLLFLVALVPAVYRDWTTGGGPICYLRRNLHAFRRDRLFDYCDVRCTRSTAPGQALAARNNQSSHRTRDAWSRSSNWFRTLNQKPDYQAPTSPGTPGTTESGGNAALLER